MSPKHLERGDTVAGRYEIIKELGEGGFGAVYEVVERKTKRHYAMKYELEVSAEDEPGLDTEGAVLKRMQGKEHILRYIDVGKLGTHTFLVMELAGTNLSQLRKGCPDRHFSLSTGSRMALQCLDAIEVVHNCGFLHRDIKPGNFAIGFDGKRHQIFILDFGLVRRFRMKDGTIRPKRPEAGFRGSVRYASINCHKHLDLGRHDDLWCWMYSVVEMHTGKLPWSAEDDDDKVGEMKMNTKREELLKPMESAYHTIYKELEQMVYESTPNYRKYKAELNAILHKKQIKEGERYDWEIKVSYRSHSRKKRNGRTKSEKWAKAKPVKSKKGSRSI